MRKGFRRATGTGMLVLFALCGWADARQQTEASPSSAAQPKAALTGAGATIKADSAPSAVATISSGAPVLSPAAANRKAWKCLTDGLAEKNYDRRAQTVAALGTIGLRSDAVSRIEGSLNDKDAPVRLAAVDVLGAMKSRSSIPKLQAALDDKSGVVRFAAAQALLIMGNRSGQDLFVEVLEGDHKVSASLVSGSLHTVHEELHDPTALAELGAVQAAGAFLGPAGFGVTAAIEMSKDTAAPARAISARLLADDTSDDARQVLRDALRDKSWIVRAAAAEALGVHGSSNDIGTLAPLLDDEHKEVRYRAAAAIIRSYRSRQGHTGDIAVNPEVVVGPGLPGPAR
jgi:HEAT repeat protein